MIIFFLSTMLAVLMSVNPWFYVLGAVGLYFLWRRFSPELQWRLAQWRHTRAEQAEAAEIKKNPDLFRARMEAVDAQRRRMQERYDLQAAEAAQREAEREEERRKQRVADLEGMMQGKGYRNKVRMERAEFSDGVDRSDSSDNNKAKKRSAGLRPGTLVCKLVIQYVITFYFFHQTTIP